MAGGRRGGSKRNRTSPVTTLKKLRNETFSPPPIIQAVTTQRQRADPPTQDRSDSESLSGYSYTSSENSQSISDVSHPDPSVASPSDSSTTVQPAPFPLNSSRLVDENVVRQTMENIRDTVNKVQVSLVESMTKQNYYMMRPWRKTGRNSSEKKWLPEFVTSMDIIVSSIHVEDLTECPFRLSPCGLGRVIKIYCKNYCEASRGRGYTITQQPPRKVYPAPCKTKQRCMYILLNKRCYMGVKQCVNSMAPM
eukprot:XP_016658092.1 PREDICTED: uncharacterized protein LOC107883125 [Acyrthosiphon pisum]